MDWMKSKSILLLALLLTNLILLWNVIDSRHTFESKKADEAKEWKKVVSLANQRQIDLQDSSALYYVSDLSGVRLEYQMYDAEQIANRLLGNSSVLLGKYSNGTGDQLTLENGNKLLYAKNIPMALKEKGLSAEEAKKKADQFIEDSGFASADMKLWDIKQAEETTTVIYRQYYQRLFLDDAYMAVTFKGAQMSTFERKWFNPPEHLNYSRNIIPPSKALFLALDQVQGIGKEKRSIKAFELGYRLDSSSLVSSVKAGEASPYWRVLMDTGDVYYVEAQEQ